MQIAHATARKSLIPAPPKGGLRYRRASFSHRHSHGESLAGGLAAALVITLVIVGLIYAVAVGREAPAELGSGVTGFPQHRTARIVVPNDDGRCREHAFYNDNGLMGPDRL